MDINIIASWFNQIIAKVHFCHHNTTSFETHKATDYLYTALYKLKDELIEKTIGYTGTGYNKVTLSSIEGDPDQMYSTLGKEVISFSVALGKWADDNKYGDISNLSQELSGHGAKYNYLITLH